MAIADHVGREAHIKALGRDWILSRWDRKIWDEFIVWARTKLPDPIEVGDKFLAKLSLEEQDIIGDKQIGEELREKRLAANRSRQQLWVKQFADKGSSYLAINSEEVQSLLNSHIGGPYALYLLLRKHQSGVTEQEAEDIHREVSAADMKRAWGICLGRTHEGNGQSPGRPGT